MLIIKVDNKKGIERALKEYKSKVIKTRQSRELSQRKEFKNKSQEKRDIMNKAVYRQKLFDKTNN